MFFKKNKNKFNSDQALKLLREKYYTLAENYSKNIFNPDLFEERYRLALKNRINLESFFAAEFQAIDQILKDIKKPKLEKLSERPNSFTKKVEDILEEYDERVKVYPYIDFHPKAHEDLKYLYGGLKLFYKEIFFHLESIYTPKIVGSTISKDFSKYYRFIEYAARESKNNVSKRISDYLITIRNYDDDKSEKNYRNFMIDTGSYFNELKVFLNNSMEKIESHGQTISLKSKILGQSKYSYHDFVLASIEWIDNFLHNFRIHDFV